MALPGPLGVKQVGSLVDDFVGELLYRLDERKSRRENKKVSAT
jgi:hypothetical protein